MGRQLPHHHPDLVADLLRARIDHDDHHAETHALLAPTGDNHTGNHHHNNFKTGEDQVAQH
jgi:hypothetical protein